MKAAITKQSQIMRVSDLSTGIYVLMNFPLSYSFQRCVATFLSGTPNPAFFGAEDAESVPPNNFYVQEDDIIKSVARQVPVGGVSDDLSISGFPPVWKIFSEEKVSDSLLDEMFQNRSQVR